MFELPSTAEKLGCACVVTVPAFACVGPVCKCNIDLRLTGLLTLSLVGDAQQEVGGKNNSNLLRLQFYFVTPLCILKIPCLSTTADVCWGLVSQKPFAWWCTLNQNFTDFLPFLTSALLPGFCTEKLKTACTRRKSGKKEREMPQMK